MSAASLSLACVGKHMERPTSSGLWRIPTGFRNYHLDTRLASGIATLLGRGQRNVTLLDMGAGKGLYVRYFRTAGLKNVTGYEGVPNIEELTAGRIKQRDFTKPFVPCQPFDVVVCLEVAEHIPKALESVFLANLNCSARAGVVLSWARMGQFGTGHVNLRDRADVLKTFDALGFVEDRRTSVFLRDQAYVTWFRRNMLALHRRGQPSPFQQVDTFALEPKPATTTGLDATSVLEELRGAYSKLEARLDELGGLPQKDVLINWGLGEYRKALLKLSDAAKHRQRAEVKAEAAMAARSPNATHSGEDEE